MGTIEGHEPGTSASTIRGLRHLDMALLSEPPPEDLAEPSPHHSETSLYHPHSPHSIYQSEPGSPSGDSVSSFPSVSSSFLFSSGPASPPHPHPASEPESELGDSTSGLVIPSLILPSASRRPTPFGQTLGELRLLLLGPKGANMSALASQLVDDNEDVVEVGLWEEEERREGGSGSARGKRKAVLRASTHWVEHRDAHGLERVEPARNVEIVELPSYDPYTEVDSVIERVLPVIHSPFYQVMEILDREHPPNSMVAHILSSASSPLHTALVLRASPLPSSSEKALIDGLSPHIPIILLPSASTSLSARREHTQPNVSYKITSPYLSAFRPSSIDSLRIGLFRTPTTLASLRAEAAARFLRWREVERAVERVQWGAHALSSSQSSAAKTPMPPHSEPKIPRTDDRMGWWDKQAWEAQWEDNLSKEVAVHLRRKRAGTAHRITPLSSRPPAGNAERQTSYFHRSDASGVLDTLMPRDADHSGGLLSPPCPSAAAFDPLHLPSLFLFSFSLLGALRSRIARTFGFGLVPQRANNDTARRAVAGSVARERKCGSTLGYTFGLGLALVSAFCAGVGIGLFAARF
ncbi:hypothetical protein BD413DRAFT_486047 [Trametes elegans]|nr:hypothetical protein BD413DRAFT_486047 [Trametes elegans]